MDSHQKVIDTVQKYLSISGQLSEALAAQQLALNLEEIFLPKFLACSEKRKESLAKLDELSSLLEAHKEYYNQLMVQFESELLFRFDQYSEDEKSSVITRHIEKLQYRIMEQYTFVCSREEWILHVRSLVFLLENNPDQLSVIDDTLELQDSIFDEFISIQSKIQKASEKEREIGEARRKRIALNATNLGFKFDFF